MKRREAVKGILLFSLGTGMIYSCTDPYQAVRELNLDFVKPEDSQMAIIQSISDIILPIKNIPELAEHITLPFILKMVDDNFKEKERNEFITAYQSWDMEVEKMGQMPYSKMTIEEKSILLQKCNDEKEVMPKSMQNFYDVIKSQSIKYLTTSEHYQRTVNYYEMAPGRFHGDVMLSDLKNMNPI